MALMVAAFSNVRWGIAAALAGSCVIGVCIAEETAPRTDEETRKLERVREEIRRLQAKLDQSRSEAKGLLGDLQQTDLELSLHRKQIGILGKELEQCRIGMQDAETRLEESRR